MHTLSTLRRAQPGSEYNARRSRDPPAPALSQVPDEMDNVGEDCAWEGGENCAEGLIRDRETDEPDDWERRPCFLT
jgi:hypothetical protein